MGRALHQGIYGKILVDWPAGTKYMERTHRIAFMAANKIIKTDLPSHDADGNKLEVFPPMAFASNRVTPSFRDV